MPRSFSRKAWWRFSQDRRRRYLSLLSAEPSHTVTTRIETLVRLEWQALKAEAENTLQADREAREHRRLFDRLLSDFERPQSKTYRDMVAERERGD